MSERMDNGLINGYDLLQMELPGLVAVEDGRVGFPGDGYWIDLSDIKNWRDLVDWTHHLACKTWVTGEHIAQFIEAVCEHKGWRLW